MKSCVIVFPASNCDRDAATALERITGKTPAMVWHKETELPARTDLVMLPGGFSYGDYLRCGAMAAREPIMKAIKAHADKGGYVLGVCNGFQVLTEAQMLPGALMRNATLKFICKDVELSIDNSNTAFTRSFGEKRSFTIPIAHGEGNYFADKQTLDRLEAEGRVIFRYKQNPNGAARNIAGIMNERANVLGMMPHPERAADPALGGVEGLPLFQSLIEAIG